MIAVMPEPIKLAFMGSCLYTYKRMTCWGYITCTKSCYYTRSAIISITYMVDCTLQHNQHYMYTSNKKDFIEIKKM